MKLYEEYADWFHLITAPHEYAEEAVFIAATIDSLAAREIRTLLELGSGGGNNASFLKRRYEMTLSDLSPRMLAVSRRINPEVEHVQGDMRSLRLGRRFDAVLIHDAIVHLTEEDDLAAAIVTAAEHTAPGGVVLLAPDDTAESYRPRTESGGHDGEDRSARYLMWDHAVEGTTYRSTVLYALDDGRTTHVEHEEWTLGLFPRATWLRLIEAAGLEPRVVTGRYPVWDDERTHEMFAGIKPT